MKKQTHQMLNYRHQIFPNKTQTAFINDDIFAANQVYNIVLNLLDTQYIEYCGFRTFVNDFRTHIGQKTIKKVPYHWMTNTQIDRKIRSILGSRDIYCPTDVMQGERKIAMKAYKDGLDVKSDKDMPKFRKSSRLHGAFSWVNARTDLYSNSVKISARMGAIKMRREREFPEGSKLKTVRFKKENNKFFAVFTLELDKKILTEKDFLDDYEDSLGMDTNNGHLDFSDGTVTKYGRSLSEKELARLKNKKAKKLVKENERILVLERKQAKRKEVAKEKNEKLGQNYYKDQEKLNKITTKQKNRRKNLLDKVSNEILSKALSVLFLEDLSVKSMTAKANDKKSNSMSAANSKQMRKNILNFSYSTLHSMLFYKAMLTGRLVVFVDPAYTTQECSCCHSRQKMPVKIRVYNCDCGFSLARDWNSAINIHTRGITFFEELNSSCLAA